MKKTKTIQLVPTNQLKPAVYNPRHWPDSAVKQLTESIKRFGLVDPLIVNSASKRRDVLIGGHFRLHVAKRLGIKEVPVVYVNIPEIEREKELNLRLNRNQGEWDWDLLKDFDVSDLLSVGFDEEDLAHIWDQQLAVEDDEFNVEEAIKDIKKPTTKVGDLITLGAHRLICGDSTNPSIVGRLMGDTKADMLYSDPPYNIGLDYNAGIGGNRQYGGNLDDRKSNDEYRQFLNDALTVVTPHMKSDHHAFVWSDQNYIGLVQSLLSDLRYDLRRVCLWVKNNQNVTPQVAFNKIYEPVIYATKGKPYLAPIHNLNEVLNKEVGTGNRTIDDILDLLDIWMVKRLSANEYEHPTAKPPTLHEKPLRRCTKPGDAVVDLFGGSGSTLIAAEQLKRRAFLVEKEPVFCDVIINRYKQLTGNDVQYSRA